MKKDKHFLYHQNNFYVIGKSPEKILCYDEERDWTLKDSYHFTENPLLFVQYQTKQGAINQIQYLEKEFGIKLKLYRYAIEISVEEDDS